MVGHNGVDISKALLTTVLASHLFQKLYLALTEHAR